MLCTGYTEETAPRTQTQGCYLHDTRVFIQTNTQEGRNEWGHRREKGVNPLWNTGERTATGLCFSLWYCYLFNSRGQEAKQRRGCAEMFSAQLRWKKMSSSIRPRCEKQRVISKNDFRESVTSTDHCVHFKLRLMINLKSFFHLSLISPDMQGLSAASGTGRKWVKNANVPLIMHQGPSKGTINC